MPHRKRHKSDSKTFSEETWKEQASSINATVLQLERVIKAHIRRAASENRNHLAIRAKCVKQVVRMILRIL